MLNGDVKLADFGTARYVDGAEPSILAAYPAAPGDSRYASPEMHALLHDNDPAIARKGDIFALGATLFELCSGAILGVQVFDAAFALDLSRTMGVVSSRDRQRVYLQFVQNLEVGHPLPSISEYVTDIPSSVRGLVDSLYRAMSALDYRRRLCDFGTIFMKIDQCLLTLRNEDKVRRWQRQRELFRRNRRDKLARRQGIVLKATQGNTL
jgi:serine/threonine protein kinase